MGVVLIILERSALKFIKLYLFRSLRESAKGGDVAISFLGKVRFIMRSLRPPKTFWVLAMTSVFIQLNIYKTAN